MNFQNITISLLDGNHKAASAKVAELAPGHAKVFHLKILLEPLSSESRVWVNSSFATFGSAVCYEVFRPLTPADVNAPITGQNYLKTSQAISRLLTPSSADNPNDELPELTSAIRLPIVFQKPRTLENFMNIYIAIAGTDQSVSDTALAATIKAVEGFFAHFNSYYYVKTST